MQHLTQGDTVDAQVKAEDRPHYPFVVITSDGYWGRGQTKAEAVKGARDAGYRKRRGVKVKLIECPPNIRDASVDSYGAFCYFAVDDKGPTYTCRML